MTEKRKNRISNYNRIKNAFLCSSIIICFLASVYLTIVYSSIPFVEKWRTIYIETAMTTNSHQWLATLFFPKSVIDEVMSKRQRELDAQTNLSSKWEEQEKENPESKSFFSTYWELDTPSVKDFFNKNPYIL